MPKNVMKQLKPKANIGRNAFDLSHRSVFTANFGELLPCCCIETVPSNDEIIIRPADLVRAMPLATSPFLRAKQHIDFWFVPYSALWSRFNEFMVDRDEPASSALKSKTYLPYVSLDAFRNLIDDIDVDQYRDIVGRPYVYGANKLLNLLGYGVADGYVGVDNDVVPKVNIFRLCAYNYIWYKEYRQQYYDTGLHLMPSSVTSPSAVARLWNLDECECDQVANADVEAEFGLATLRAMTQLRYRCYKKDLFTGLMPSQQYGDVSVVTGSLSSTLGVPTYEDSEYPDDPSRSDLVYDAGKLVRFLDGDYNPLYVRNTGISVLDLRKAEAVQRWRENALRAGNQVEDNFEAHYGAKPRSHMITHPSFIGSYDAPLNIGDVVSTAQTGDGENQALGDIAGKGLSSVNGNKITFKTNDFGVIIGMFSLLPETEYNGTGIDRMNQLLEREDFFVPEYERLGLEPVDSFTFYSGYHGEPTDRKGIVGFAPRYWGYKQKLDRCYGELQHTGFKTGMFAHWCSPKDDVEQAIISMQNDGVFPLSLLYVNPAVFDINFNVSVQNADQFLVDMFNEVTAIRGMSVSGMPGY